MSEVTLRLTKCQAMLLFGILADALGELETVEDQLGLELFGLHYRNGTEAEEGEQAAAATAESDT